MTEPDSIYKRLVKHFGGQVKTALAVEVSQPSVSGWVSGKKKMSWKTAKRAEKATAGTFKAIHLCPDLEEFEHDNLSTH